MEHEQTIIDVTPTYQDVIPYQPSQEYSLDTLIDEWLEATYTDKSRSERTRDEYSKRMQQLRAILHENGLDLDSREHEEIARIAKQWAQSRAEGSRYANRPIAQSTYNLRLATISSFYTFIQKKQRHDGRQEYPNPIDRIERPRIAAYENAAQPLESDFVRDALASIDRRTAEGKRNYAVLALGLSTGRRASELVNLRARHLTIVGNKIRVFFERCKGGKKKRDLLDEDTTQVILDYLHAVYGEQLQGFKDGAPVWVSFSRRNAGQPMSIHTLYDICEKILHTTKIHTLRHTFAHQAEASGATVSDLQHRLGHATIAQTGTYLLALRSDENPIGAKLASSFGIQALPTK